MPAATRLGDQLATGHICQAVTVIGTTPQSTVFVNDILTNVIGAMTVPHSAPPVCAPHTAPIHQGSPDVFVEKIPWGRVTDATDAGQMIQGSPDVFVNG